MIDKDEFEGWGGVRDREVTPPEVSIGGDSDRNLVQIRGFVLYNDLG